MEITPGANTKKRKTSVATVHPLFRIPGLLDCTYKGAAPPVYEAESRSMCMNPWDFPLGEGHVFHPGREQRSVELRSVIRCLYITSMKGRPSAAAAANRESPPSATSSTPGQIPGGVTPPGWPPERKQSFNHAIHPRTISRLLRDPQRLLHLCPEHPPTTNTLGAGERGVSL